MWNLKGNAVSGNLNISVGVIQEIVREAILEIEGIAGLAPLPMNWKEYLLRAKKSDSIRIDMHIDTVAVTVGICVDAGVPVQKLARTVQQQVKNSVQEMTGLAVSKVCVYVAAMSDQEKGNRQGDVNE